VLILLGYKTEQVKVKKYRCFKLAKHPSSSLPAF